MAEEKKTKKTKKLEEYKKPNEEVEKIIEKVQKGEDVENIEKEVKEEKQEKKEEKENEKKEKKDSSKSNIKSDNMTKPELEREYIIPLRKKVWKVPRYKRAKKAIKVIREFLARHMKVSSRDLKKVKIDKWLNQEVWFRGIKKPPAKIKVKASKIDGVVRVELAEIPEKIKWEIQKEEKAKKETVKVKKAKAVKKESIEKTEEENKEEEEKEKASVEAGLERQKIEAKKIEHTTVKIPAGEKFERPEGQFKRKAMKR